MLDVSEIAAWFQPEGRISRHLKGFEARGEQLSMLQDVAEAFNHQKIALIEAGTGTGKSLAYLVPAITWAVQEQETVVISTATINLQEQLLHKDIPLVLKALNAEVEVALIKGMSQYLCLRKLEDLSFERLTGTDKEAEELEMIEAWASQTHDGSLANLPFFPSYATWDAVNADPYACSFRECPHFRHCHFLQARRKAKNARIIIVNHHLLFADLVKKAETESYDQPAILPPYSRVIMDEAHNIESIATEFFASQVNRLQALRLLSKVFSEKTRVSSGKIAVLKTKIQSHFRSNVPAAISSLISQLQTQIPQLKREAALKINQAFQVLAQSMMQSPQFEKENAKIRILPEFYSDAHSEQTIIPAIKEATDAGTSLVHAIHSTISLITEMKNTSLDEAIASVRTDLLGINKQLENFLSNLNEFSKVYDIQQSVRWMETQEFQKGGFNLTLYNAPLQVSEILTQKLFSKMHTAILCSATMATNQNFHFLKERLGLTSQSNVIESIYTSPFNYQKQACFAVPSDIPLPNQGEFLSAATEHIYHFLKTCDGNAFVLFTSYSMLNRVFDTISSQLHNEGFTLLRQGSDHRQKLIERFKKEKKSVLFGTDSFWEGVDVSGDALRCVILVKLPFKVPSDPMIQARCEAISSKGGDPFAQFSIPDAIVKFKQGFGRLIRTGADSGFIICLDKRLLTKEYGNQFLRSLPECPIIHDNGSSIRKSMKEFFNKKKRSLRI
ncbi:MAG: ATP-dependent DNA helicase DinG [Chlamydiales bacterium]